MQLTVLIHALICGVLAGYMTINKNPAEFNEAHSES